MHNVTEKSFSQLLSNERFIDLLFTKTTVERNYMTIVPYMTWNLILFGNEQ